MQGRPMRIFERDLRRRKQKRKLRGVTKPFFAISLLGGRQMAPKLGNFLPFWGYSSVSRQILIYGDILKILLPACRPIKILQIIFRSFFCMTSFDASNHRSKSNKIPVFVSCLEIHVK